MSYQRRSEAWVVTVATAALLLAVRPAPAQSAGGYYYETFRYGYNPGYYARRYPVPSADYYGLYFGPCRTATKTAPGVVSPGAIVRYAPAQPAAPQGGGAAVAAAVSRSVRVPAAESEPRARLELRVPKDAAVWFGDVRTEQTGALRLFESPPLAPGKEYVYTVRVAWQEAGNQVEESRDMTVRAGEQLTATFPLPKAE
jgi:uncharacterized protein (TIGR03000 family)